MGDFRIVMLGKEEDVVPFKFLITFSVGNEKFSSTFEWQDNIYSINCNKCFLTNGEQCAIFSLKKLTEYFDIESKAYKIQPYIQFNLKIFCPNLNLEVANEVQIYANPCKIDEVDDLTSDVNMESRAGESKVMKTVFIFKNVEIT